MKLIDIVKELYGFSTKEAKTYLKGISEERKKDFNRIFCSNLKKIVL